MKWNNEIKDVDDIHHENYVYNVDKAKQLFNSKKYSYRKLSLMKQENIRIVLKEKKLSLEKIKNAIACQCGYCFVFYNHNDYKKQCKKCPLYKRFGKGCYNLIEYQEMMEAKKYKTFAELHKLWCKRLGLWREEWK